MASAKEDYRKQNAQAGKVAIDNVMADPHQVRKHISQSELTELAASIEKRGILQPLVLRWDDSHKKHVIIAGERRYRAAVMAGLKEVPCVFRDDEGTSEADIRIDQLAENCHRKDLTAYEEAVAFREFMELTGHTASEAAAELSISKSRFSKRLRLLELAPELQGKVQSGKVSPDVAYALASKIRTPEKQLKVAADIEKRGLSRDQAVSFIAKKSGKKSEAKASANSEGQGGENQAKAAPRRQGATRQVKLPSRAVIRLAWPRKELTDKQLLQVAEEFLTYVRELTGVETSGEEAEPKKRGKDAAVKD